MNTLNLTQLKNIHTTNFKNYQIVGSLIGSQFVLDTVDGSNDPKTRGFTTLKDFNKQYSKCYNWGLKNRGLIETKTEAKPKAKSKTEKEIEKFDANTINILANELRDLLKGFAEKHGLNHNGANITYDAVSFSSNIKFGIENFDELNKMYNSLFALYNIGKNIFGSIITLQGKQYKVVNYNKRTKNKFRIEDINTGKLYQVSMETIAKVYPAEDFLMNMLNNKLTLTK